MLENVKRIINFPLEDDKIRKFITVCDEIYTKEYLGIDDYGKDVEYEEQLTSIAAAYEISIFYLPQRSEELRYRLIEKLKEKTPTHPSQLICF
jgi:hypothetical protein